MILGSAPSSGSTGARVYFPQPEEARSEVLVGAAAAPPATTRAPSAPPRRRPDLLLRSVHAPTPVRASPPPASSSAAPASSSRRRILCPRAPRLLAGAYRGIAHCGATVARAEGMSELWKGLTPFATHLTLKYALRLGSNALLQSVFKDPGTGKVSAHGRLASGFGAGVLEGSPRSRQRVATQLASSKLCGSDLSLRHCRLAQHRRTTIGISQ